LGTTVATGVPDCYHNWKHKSSVATVTTADSAIFFEQSLKQQVGLGQSSWLEANKSQQWA
jgi:hypothetical protein